MSRPGEHGPAATRALRAFLCHSSGDKPAVRELYRWLRRQGVDPWLDEEDLLAGQDWAREIPKAVRGSDVVIVCLSKAAVTRAGYVQKEIRTALDMAEEQPEGTIFIIPLKLEECEVPERLSRWHWVALHEPDGHERLLHALHHRARSLGVSAAPLRSYRDAPHEFLSEDDIVELVATERLPSDERPVKALLLFATADQHTWLVATDRRLFCVLDEAENRAWGTLVQWDLALADAEPVGAYLSPRYRSSGLIDIGPRRSWLYSRRLFDTPESAAAAVRQLVHAGRSSPGR